MNRLIQDHLSQAITRKLLRKEPAKEETLRMLVEDVKLVKCRMQASTAQLATADELVVRGEQLVILLALHWEFIQLRDTKDSLRPCSSG